MASAPIILYLCCWLARQSKVSGQLPAPGPSISVSPSGVIALGGAVTIRCQCRCEARRLFLYKGGLEIQELDADGDEGEFTIPSAKREDRGVYSCRSRSRTEPPNWSDPSNIVPIIVAELSYPKPSIFLSPNGGVTLGGAVTIQCWGQRQNVRFLLFKDGNPNTQQDTEPAGDLAEFSIRSVSRRDAGSYSCQYSTKWDPPVWSEPSDPVELVVAEPSYPKPNISLLPSEGVAPGGAVTIRCECRCRGARVFLSKSGDPDARCATDSAGDLVEFPIYNVSRRDAGRYSCQYSTKWGLPVWSEPSDPVELVVAEGTDPAGTQQPDPPMTEPAGEGGTDPTQLGTAPAPTRPGSAGPGGSEPSAAPDLTRCIMAGVSATAAGLLLLLLAFLCYRSTRGRKGPDPRQSRESEAAATVYALVGEGKQLDVLPQEPDPEAEGLTYAELDHQGLQAKRGGPAPAPEPVLYAAINVSQGAHRQSPQGAGAPPHPHSVNPGGVIGATGQGALATRG
ncbi:leukocyte immunoglobulin-like receptor subfamily B member 5 isoform X1 [Chelonia mydas]|uniref:leukocyte immunoglobulin-like receptor subfamily B member 5 isoform X1 n=1 Tax=Chelonia mydas TaxID=8469 RepID=UPI001CA8B202|nr:leukocyte immunoglobulin-like receptor subfamily B member 5 isoform X1 [Chelonia mydas]